MNKMMVPLLTLLSAAVFLTGPGRTPAIAGDMNTVRIYSAESGTYADLPYIEKTAMEWKQALTAEQFHILREEGTERPFTGNLWDHHEEGVYRCAGCGTDLFSSSTKYDSGTGWPSFWQPVDPGNIREVEDNGFFIRRVEVQCARCGGHLGHVFRDGPKPTGLRYCINSASLVFARGAFQGSPMKTGG